MHLINLDVSLEISIIFFIFIFRSLPKEQIPELQQKLLGKGHPNTYSFTKGLGEHLVAEEAGDLPVAILRPSIVMSTYRDPVPGWVCGIVGITSIIYWVRIIIIN